MTKEKVIKWIKAAGIRAIRTFAQVLGGFVVVGLSVADIKWQLALSVTVVATLASLLTSLASLPELEE